MFQIIRDENNIIRTIVQSNDLQPGAVEVSQAVYDQAAGKVGRARLVDAEVVDLPAEPVPSFSARTYKADIWREATDAEAVTIDAQINAQPVRLRNLFRDCDFLDHADPYFIQLKAGFVAQFGPDRAAELLAPSA
ncbi:hypothetical protein [Microvirga sesbaniae]|uniref:hypothetical protein n=1 Tax=Microvirga sesbaniae TaxID=681392 RepID=UPI0021C73B6D|nr:hypothetical protein [Microvirga sp. HBU67692]